MKSVIKTLHKALDGAAYEIGPNGIINEVYNFLLEYKMDAENEGQSVSVKHTNRILNVLEELMD